MLARSVVLASLMVTGVSLTSVGASAQNIDQYCKERLGFQSQAVMLDRGDAYSWKCSTGSRLLNVVVNDLCIQQFGRGYRSVALSRGDAYSWRCVR